MALMGVDEAAYSTRNNPIAVKREPLRDYAPQSGVQPNDLHSDGALLLYRLHAKANEEAAEARRKLPDRLRGISEDDWESMDWANGIKPREAVTVMGEAGLNRVWNAPNLGFRPDMKTRPKGGMFSQVRYGGRKSDQASEDEKREDGSKKKEKKKGWRYGKMSVSFDDLAEDFGADRNETELVGPVANVTEPSMPESVLGFGWTDEDMGIWVKYGLSPACLMAVSYTHLTLPTIYSV